jgi:uncharacterized lipoprotein YmbA
MQKHPSSIILILFILAAVWGCAGKSQNARFYVLSSMKEAPMTGEAKAAHSDLVLGIGPITIADYLNRQDIVTRDSSNKLAMNEFEQWAGSFDNNFIKEVCRVSRYCGSGAVCSFL